MNISVIFTKSKHVWAIGSKIIAESEKRNYSHVAIKYNCPITNEPMIFQASKGMVNCSHLDNFIIDNQIQKEYTIPCDPISFKLFYEFKCKMLGKKYSKKQILWFGLKKLISIHKWPVWVYKYIQNGDSEFICSEIGTLVCKIFGAKVDEVIQLDQISPSDLEQILIENKYELKHNG